MAIDQADFPFRELVDSAPEVRDHDTRIALANVETERILLLERENHRANAYLTSAVDAVRDAFALYDEQDRAVMPVIGLSAAALVRDTKRATEAGFHRYLTKPVKVAELIAALEDLLVHHTSPSRPVAPTRRSM